VAVDGAHRGEAAKPSSRHEHDVRNDERRGVVSCARDRLPDRVEAALRPGLEGDDAVARALGVDHACETNYVPRTGS
jgi:hypothetical protein